MDELERLDATRRLLIEPLIKTLETEIRSEIAPIVARLSDVDARVGRAEGRVTALESTNRKALVGFAVWASIFGLAWQGVYQWVRQKLSR